MLRWSAAVLLVPALAACSWVDPRPFVQSRVVAVETPMRTTADLPTITAFREGVATVLRAHKLNGPPAVTLLRRAPPISPADWMACMRSYMEPAPPLALFFSGDRLVDHRIAVMIDDCARADYGPLPE